MNIDFKKLPYKDFNVLIDKIVLRAYGKEINDSNKYELYIRLKYYSDFIKYIIKINKLERLFDFEKVVNDNTIYQEDSKEILKLYDAMRTTLNGYYIFIDVTDIANFCKKIGTDIKI